MEKIDVKKAIELALAQLVALFPQYENIELEEVEYTDDAQWLITFSYLLSADSSNALSFIGRTRKYRSVLLDKFGNFRAIKIRKVNE